ncbi:MAG TPA: CRISPR system precrRNA processing endoribonuclease RAMP protein Cas6 [Nitrospirae bacterium]|nr:CRISPR system precrRNA processing endoribonuclease RAMP protein Cas6 [Nitrospirota bacterium]
MLVLEGEAATRIRTASFSFRVRPREPMVLPAYKGSALRGGFGHAFRRVVCALKRKECADCLLRDRCVYAYVFETPPPEGTQMMRKYTSAPHPFVIEPPPETRRGYTPEDEMTFGLILIGRAIDYLPYFVYAFDELGRIGLGRGNAGFDLLDVGCSGMSIYDAEARTLGRFDPVSLDISFPAPSVSGTGPLTLRFLTPTRIVYSGRLTLDIEFHMLIRNLLRRLSLLHYFHCDGEPPRWDFREIIKAAEHVQVEDRSLRWYDWQRYSARQKTRMKMGGFVGEATFSGHTGPFMDLIRAGEVLHVGKGTAFGLGRYEAV